MVYEDVDVWPELPRILTRHADCLAITMISVGLQTHNHMMRAVRGLLFYFFLFFSEGAGKLKILDQTPGGGPGDTPLPSAFSRIY